MFVVTRVHEHMLLPMASPEGIKYIYVVLNNASAQISRQRIFIIDVEYIEKLLQLQLYV